MAKMNVTPEEMNAIAKKVGSDIENWAEAMNSIIGYMNELNSMWEGESKGTFMESFEQDVQKFKQMQALMVEYQNAIVEVANIIVEGEKSAASIAAR